MFKQSFQVPLWPSNSTGPRGNVDNFLNRGRLLPLHFYRDMIEKKRNYIFSHKHAPYAIPEKRRRKRNAYFLLCQRKKKVKKKRSMFRLKFRRLVEPPGVGIFVVFWVFPTVILWPTPFPQCPKGGRVHRVSCWVQNMHLNDFFFPFRVPLHSFHSSVKDPKRNIVSVFQLKEIPFCKGKPKASWANRC